MLEKELVNAVLQDWHTAPVNDKVRATLGLLEKMTLAPFEIGPDDIIPLRTVGVSDQAIEDALAICTIFNIIDRLADAFGAYVPSEEEFARAGTWLLALGYL